MLSQAGDMVGNSPSFVGKGGKNLPLGKMENENFFGKKKQLVEKISRKLRHVEGIVINL